MASRTLLTSNLTDYSQYVRRRLPRHHAGSSSLAETGHPHGQLSVRARCPAVSVCGFPLAGTNITYSTSGGLDMRTRLAWGILAAAVIAVAGCSAQDDSGTPSAGASAGTPSAPASSSAADPAAAAALGQAAAALGNTSFKVSMTAGPTFKL